MKLFISWSGEFSKGVAECLNKWIPTIIQNVHTFYSPNDIAKGEHWSNRLSEELEQSNYGIICLTPENVMAPWIHFEAGALSKVSGSRVSAIMIGINPSDVKGPLAHFQNTAFNRKDFYSLFQSINSSLEKPLEQSILNLAFNNSWEGLERDISAIIEEYLSHTPFLEKTNHSVSSSFPSDATCYMVSCDPAIVDDIFPVVAEYAQFTSPESKKIFQATLSTTGQCAAPVNFKDVFPFLRALKELGAKLYIGEVV